MYGCMNDYKEIVGVVNVTLMTQVTGFEELQSEMSDQDLCSLNTSVLFLWQNHDPFLVFYPSIILFLSFLFCTYLLVS